MQHLGKTIKFEFAFKPSMGQTWPAVHILVNNAQIGSYEITKDKPSIELHLHFSRKPNNISICYFNKMERETIIENGKIVADQALELLYIRADDILLEPWFWTDHSYTPGYFQGYLKQFPDAPKEVKSQLIWHFPGRYMIMELPNVADFWDWYQKERTSRVLSTLVDPTGQIRDNMRGMSDEDRAIVAELKEVLND